LLSYFLLFSVPPNLFFTLSLHDALPISYSGEEHVRRMDEAGFDYRLTKPVSPVELEGLLRMLEQVIKLDGRHGFGEAVIEPCLRSEEHTSELQSPYDLVCPLLL